MRLEAKRHAALNALDSVLEGAQEPSFDILAKIVSVACARISHQVKTETFDRVIGLAKIGAWTDAAFALIALELPFWRVRRLVYENGEWLCSLSNQPNLPMSFDDCAEAAHEVLPLAILCAFVEACGRRHAIQKFTSAVPQVELWRDDIICCDNYR